ncbi:MAG: hypothetical protein J0I24_00240 [Thiomonas arsenitoxydans]|uniref:Methyltransferase type 11 domain-containing protein n=1 Tax=Thiomonas arsenitoxydans (strain DSM 22701 / CIP 110005 / 3As) TaxID=426114 RepID=A0A8I1MSN9_THIA3|nr:hypothetical protein [Thiomonas arsenitoxydans]MBN8742713.1 hypothetical protein [Thiomonas arsenitoxydans]
MSNITLESLVVENRILKNQANQLRYFLVGSRVDALTVSDVEYGQTLYCSHDALNRVATSLLRPADVCLDIGPGVRPQRMLNCPVHVLVEPHRPYAEKLVVTYPGKAVYCVDGLEYFKGALDKSTDTVFMLDVIEHLEKEDGHKLLAQALRVARKQVVIFTPLGFMPQHYTESVSWEGVTHSELQNHRSGWEPNEFANAIHVVCEDYHSSGSKVYGAFYSIIDASVEMQPRLVLVSDGVPSDFQFQDGDVIIADVMFSELSWKINYVPKRNMIAVPLELIAAESLTAREILRSSIINFHVLEGYLQRCENVVAVGASAEVVLQRHRNGWS